MNWEVLLAIYVRDKCFRFELYLAKGIWMMLLDKLADGGRLFLNVRSRGDVKGASTKIAATSKPYVDCRLFT